MGEAQFYARLKTLTPGYQVGRYEDNRWGVTIERSSDRRRMKLYAEKLSGGDHVSFNLYYVGGEPRLKPCEMPKQKVIDFVCGVAFN